MSGYLFDLLTRSFEPRATLRPRVPSLFAPPEPRQDQPFDLLTSDEELQASAPSVASPPSITRKLAEEHRTPPLTSGSIDGVEQPPDPPRVPPHGDRRLPLRANFISRIAGEPAASSVQGDVEAVDQTRYSVQPRIPTANEAESPRADQSASTVRHPVDTESPEVFIESRDRRRPHEPRLPLRVAIDARTSPDARVFSGRDAIPSRIELPVATPTQDLIVLHARRELHIRDHDVHLSQPASALREPVTTRESPIDSRGTDLPLQLRAVRELCVEAHRAERATEPVIEVTIGRIEVRSSTRSESSRLPAATSPGPSLSEYLRRRSGRSPA
jgi:hypothetical protein